MASPKVVTTNQDLPSQPSMCSLSTLLADPSKTITMDELLKSITPSEPPPPPKTVDEVWKEIVTGTAAESQEITLEDFLTKAGAVPQDDVTVTPPSLILANVVQTQLPVTVGGRRKRRSVEEPLDKATLQKQRRMIKNRESAARSRERKQAYTVELEALVIQLEEENARLLREEAEKNKQRLKQLMECLIPVVEERKPRRMLRRVNSVQW